MPALIIFLSLTNFTVDFFMGLLIGYLKTFPLEIEGGQVSKSVYTMGVVLASAHVRMTEGRGQFFHILVRTY